MLTENILSSGDDQGQIRLWDILSPPSSKPTHLFHEHEQTCTGLALHPTLPMLVSTSVDGTLAVYDLRSKQQPLYAMSDSFQQDLQTVQIVKNGKKVVTSTSQGSLNLFSWDWFGDCDDRIGGHPCSVNTVIKMDQDTLITGADDGLIRGVGLFPNKILNIVGDHYPGVYDDKDRYPVEKVSITWKKDWIGSIGHDGYVKFFNVEVVRDRVKTQKNYDQQIQIENQKEQQQQQQQTEDIGNNWEDEDLNTCKQTNTVKDMKMKKRIQFFDDL